SRNSSNSKPERPQTGGWKFFTRGQSKGDSHWEGTCDYCGTFYPHAKPQNLRAHLANFCKKLPEEFNNLEDIPTDEPFSSATSSLVKQKKIAKQPELTNWYDSTKIEASKQLLIDEAITLAFIMCGIPFRIINNPFFINALNLLNPSYSILSCEVLSEHLLDIEYLYELGNFSDQSHTAEFLANQIELIINQI
ncbi:36261_t:CDS:2, partial [Gigaspora margarita]